MRKLHGSLAALSLALVPPAAVHAGDTLTTNLGLTKIEIGASDDSWGDKLNANADLLDAEFNRTTVGDASYAMLPGDRTILLTTALTAPRTLTLPAASTVAGGRAIRVTDMAGAIGPTNTLTVAAAGSDTIDGAPAFVLSRARENLTLVSDGSSKWAIQSVSLAVGTVVEAWDAELDALAGVASAADKLPYFTGAGSAAVTDLTSTARNLLDDGSTSAMRTTLGLAIGSDVQGWDADLDAVGGLGSAGLIARTGPGTAAVRSLTVPAAGMTVANGDGVAGNPTLALANDLSALEALAGAGIAVRTATDSWAQRTITGGTGISLTNGDGVSGNPTVAINTAVVPQLGSSNTFTAGQNVSGSAAQLLTITQSDDGSTGGPTVVFDRNSASPAASDAIGTIQDRGRNTIGGTINYGTFGMNISDPTAGSEDSYWRFVTQVAGAGTEEFRAGGGMLLGSASGGAKGLGTINATGYYLAGTSIFANANTWSGVQTFSTAPVIATISNTGTLTLPTSTDTLVGRATTDTLTNKTLTSPTIGGTATFTGTPVLSTGTLTAGSATITLPATTDVLVGRTTIDILTNKTLTTPIISGDIKVTGTASGATSCGTSPSMLSGSTDTAGGVTVGGGSPTSCTILWGGSHSNAPFCTVSSNATQALGETPSATNLVVSWSGAVSTLYYICIQH